MQSCEPGGRVSLGFDDEESFSATVHRRLLCQTCRHHFYQRCLGPGEGDHPLRCPRCGAVGTTGCPEIQWVPPGAESKTDDRLDATECHVGRRRQ
jgi:hypothetical protein